MDIGTAVGKPFSDIKTLVIGIILMIIPVVNILTIPGYMIRVANRTMNNDNSLPGFSNFGELIVDSIKYIVISIVLMIPATIVLFIAIGSMIFGALSATAMTGSTELMQEQLTSIILGGLAAAAGLIVLGIILYIIGAILIVSGIMNYAKTRQFGKAFAIKENLRNFFTGSFIVAIIVAIIIAIVLTFIVGIIVGALAFLPGGVIIGLIIAVIIQFVIAVAIVSILAEGYPHGTPVQGPQAKQVP